MATFELTGSKSFKALVTYEEFDIDAASNTSKLRIKNIQLKNTASGGYVSYLTIKVVVGGKTVADESSTYAHYQMPWSNKDTWSDMIVDEKPGFPWESNSISHNSDGTGSSTIQIYIKFTNDTNSYNGGVIDATQKITLSTIPRGSSLSLSTSSVNVGGTITANITSHSSSFTHTVEFYINNTYYKKYTGVGTSQSYKIEDSWYSAMPSSVSCTAYCRITTHNDSTQIGSSVQKSFTVNVPPDIVPRVGAITLNPVDIATKDGTSRNILVQGKNKIAVSVSGCSAGTGSSIKSYTFSGPGISTTTTSTSTRGGPISNSGTLKYTVTVTDNRGRTNSDTASITCYEYYTPKIKSFKAYRTDAEQNPDVNGAYLKCTYSIDHASVNNTNNYQVTAHYNSSTKDGYSSGVLINLNEGDKKLDYKVYITVVDSYGGTATSSYISVLGESRALNITKDGTGFAIGKMAAQNNLFECRWDAKFYGTATGPSGFSTSSDERVKKNIQDIDIDIVDSLRPIQYELIQDTNGKTHYGFVAQEVESILSDAGLNADLIGIIGQINNNNRQEYVLTYTEFIPLLTKKCQSLQQELNELRLEIENLKNNKGST